MVRNKVIFFYAGIFLIGIIAGSVYGIAKIVDAATYKAAIPEVKTIELSRSEKETPIPTSIPRIKATINDADSKAEEPHVVSEPQPKNLNNASSPVTTQNFEKDNDREDVHEIESERKEIHDVESSESKE